MIFSLLHTTYAVRLHIKLVLSEYLCLCCIETSSFKYLIFLFLHLWSGQIDAIVIF